MIGSWRSTRFCTQLLTIGKKAAQPAGLKNQIRNEPAFCGLFSWILAGNRPT